MNQVQESTKTPGVRLCKCQPAKLSLSQVSQDLQLSYKTQFMCFEVTVAYAALGLAKLNYGEVECKLLKGGREVLVRHSII